MNANTVICLLEIYQDREKQHMNLYADSCTKGRNARSRWTLLNRIFVDVELLRALDQRTKMMEKNP